jgi:UDPglucose--hexose-1-phosphate uridylyltransferase
MNELRRNPLNGRWVTIASSRAARPGDFAPRRLPVESDPSRPCPFCPGNEDAFPPALETYGQEGDWLVRVVPNLYPAFAGDVPHRHEEIGPVFTQAPASGIHEVLVLSPEHGATWGDLTDKQAGLVMAAARDRVEEHARHGVVAYTQVIVNNGREAGASLEHPHGQLLGIPFVPREIADEAAAFDRHDGCLLCTTITEERAAGHRVVLETDRVMAVSPYWAGSPYELLVMPTTHSRGLADSEPADVVAVGRALRDVLGRLGRLLDDAAYNLVFHTTPHNHDGPFHWHVHVLPQVTSVAGFEQGTGVLINIVPPETTALQLNRVPDPV